MEGRGRAGGEAIGEDRQRQAGVVGVQRDEGIESFEGDVDRQAGVLEADVGEGIGSFEDGIAKARQAERLLAVEAEAAGVRRQRLTFEDADERGGKTAAGQAKGGKGEGQDSAFPVADVERLELQRVLAFLLHQTLGKDTGAATTRWVVLGFGRASAGKGQVTPRNLMGYKDGTRNVKEDADFEKFVWINDGPAWQRRGSYQVVRKIRMHIENWDTDRVSDQNAIFGRHKVSGAPLTGEDEFDTPDFARLDAEGNPVIPATSHIRLAAFENNDGIRILRRGYNYTDGINQYGFLDAGLLFISYQNDPAYFEALQTKLGAVDALNEYITHIGSAIFFVPPAPQRGSYIGAALFD